MSHVEHFRLKNPTSKKVYHITVVNLRAASLYKVVLTKLMCVCNYVSKLANSANNSIDYGFIIGQQKNNSACCSGLTTFEPARGGWFQILN